MRRRDFIALLGGAAAWPLKVQAQQPDRMRRIGVLMPFAEGDPEARLRRNIFEEVLKKVGWIEGRNLKIDYRWTVPDFDRMWADAAELVDFAPDAILATSPPVLAELQRKTKSIPIVFVQVANPIAARFVASLAHPGSPGSQLSKTR